jgi:ankyrin repeat protein
VKDHDGHTPLEVAVLMQRADVIDALLSKNRAAKNMGSRTTGSGGKIPLQLAVEMAIKYNNSNNNNNNNWNNMTNENRQQMRLERSELARKTVCALLAGDPGSARVPDANGIIPLFRAVKANNIPLARILVKGDPGSMFDRADIFASPFEIAVKLHRDDLAKAMLDAYGKNAYVSTDKFGSTPLHFAMKYKQDALAHNILGRDSRAIEMLDKNGLSPLDYGLSHRGSTVMRLQAMKKGVFDGAIFRVIWSPESVRRLLKIDPKLALARDSRGETPLHIAARDGDTDTVKVIVRAAPESVMERNRNGRLPVDVAYGGVGNIIRRVMSKP